MISVLRYGNGRSCSLALRDEALVADCEIPRGEPLIDVSKAAEAALEQPLDFPPLAKALVPGDKVAITLADAVPQAATIIARVVNLLLAADIRPNDVTVLEPSERSETRVVDPLAETAPEIRNLISTQIHDPHHREGLCYLAASTEGHPQYISRAIHEADFVISVGKLHGVETRGHDAFRSGVFPTFSDAATLKRYRSDRGGAQQKRLCKNAEEIAWLLGARFTIQVVPGAAGTVLDILAGDTNAVGREGTRRYHEAWACDVPRQAELVVGTIEGDGAEQTWESLGAAIMNAQRAVSTDGSILVLCELAKPPDWRLRKALVADEVQLDDRRVRCTADSTTALDLARALERSKIYLVSGLDDELVEELGMLPVSIDDLPRLVTRYESCTLLRNAQYAVAEPADAPSLEPAIAKPRRRR
jgi:nickel-dependent lactate racemase